jgi:uncharacterized protein YndB with AHSA1/START domain
MNKTPITVKTIVKAPLSKVWVYWNQPDHIEQWAFATDDWEAHSAENDLRTGGAFKTTMAAKDKSASFDFGGVYTAVKEPELIEYDMTDDRHVKIEFTEVPEGVEVVQTFDPESENPAEMQRNGWQAILDNFKKYAEAN